MGVGYLSGDRCNRDGCKGILDAHPSENCSCHIDPPCYSCSQPREFCPVCDWQGADEEWPKYAPTEYVGLMVQVPKPRPLDRTKIDWRVTSHTNSSQLCRGCYPEGATKEDVEKLVKGTFGGRFNKFRDGEFEYVAYTD